MRKPLALGTPLLAVLLMSSVLRAAPAVAAVMPVAVDDRYTLQAGSDGVVLDVLGNDTPAGGVTISGWQLPDEQTGVTVGVTQGNAALLVSVAPRARTRTITFVYDIRTGFPDTAYDQAVVTVDIVGDPAQEPVDSITDVYLPVFQERLGQNHYGFHFSRTSRSVQAATRSLSKSAITFQSDSPHASGYDGKVSWYDPTGRLVFEQETSRAGTTRELDTSNNWTSDKAIVTGSYKIVFQLREYDGLEVASQTVRVDFAHTRAPFVTAKVKRPVLTSASNKPYVNQTWFIDVDFRDRSIITSIDIADDAAANVPKRLQAYCNKSGRISDIGGIENMRRLDNGLTRYTVSGSVCNLGGRHDYKVFVEWSTEEYTYDGNTLRMAGAYRLKRV